MKQNSATFLTQSRAAKADEFYTTLPCIEEEMQYHDFEGSVVLCNCDDPKTSQFWKYFSENFETLGLKKLMSTHWVKDGKSYKAELTSDGYKETPLEGDGDFRSEECVEVLKEADIVVSNPPFSLFRDYIALLMKYEKRFLVIGNQNAITCVDIFPLIRNGKLWYGRTMASKVVWFTVPQEYELRGTMTKVDEDGTKHIGVKGLRWITNMGKQWSDEELELTCTYTPEEYPEYDFYNAINVDRTMKIPKDYLGAMGVPITFLDKYNPKQFKIMNCNEYKKDDIDTKHGLINGSRGSINGRRTYARILIKRI